MSRTLVALVLVPTLFLLPALAQPAEAHGGGFSAGGWFSVGGVSFSLVFGAPVYGGPPGYYYRTPARFDYPGVHCTDRCFIRDGYAYHDPGCPVLGRYLARYHQRPYLLFEGYAPPPVWRGQFYGDGYYGGYDRYDRYGGYDRYNGYDGYGRYDRYRGDRSYRGRSWSRNDRKRYFERHGWSRHEPYRGRGGRYDGRHRGRGHGRYDHGRGRGHHGGHHHP